MFILRNVKKYYNIMTNIDYYKRKYLKYKKKCLYLQNGGKCNTKFIALEKLTSEQLEEVYNLYKETYKRSGENIWFKAPSDLLHYKCILLCDNDDLSTQKEKPITGFVMFTQFNRAKKLSLMGYSNTSKVGPSGKTPKREILELLVTLLKTPGYVAEASHATAIFLEKIGGLKALSINDVKEVFRGRDDIIVPNLKFKSAYVDPIEHYELKDDEKYSYVRISGGYENQESMYGTLSPPTKLESKI